MSQPWVRMELIPLPSSSFPATLLYWNPDSGELHGEHVEQIRELVVSSMQSGLTGDLARVELTTPYNKPTEMAAILSQHYLVVPEPVYEVPVFVSGSESHTIN